MSEIEATDGDELQYHFGFGEISETKVLGDSQPRWTGEHRSDTTFCVLFVQRLFSETRLIGHHVKSARSK
jgi:hypothetical protein